MAVLFPAKAHPLPFRASPPLAACVRDDRLHVVGVQQSTARAGHFFVERDGVTEVLPALPFAYATGLTACEESLVVTGVAPGDEEPVVGRLSAPGELKGLVELPVVGELLRWPVPLCRGGRIDVAWEIYSEPGTRIEICSPFESTAVHGLDFPVFTSYAAIGMVGSSLVTARVDPARRVVVTTAYDDRLRPLSSAELGSDVTYVDLSGGGVIAWVEAGNRLYTQRIDAGLDAVGATVPVHTAKPPTTIVDPRIAWSEDRTAIAYDLVTLGDPETVGRGPMPELGRLPRTTESRLSLVEAGETLRVGGRIHHAAWIGPDLVVLQENDVLIYSGSVETGPTPEPSG